jgi:hypothetical protein
MLFACIACIHHKSYDYCILDPSATKAPSVVEIGTTVPPAMLPASGPLELEVIHATNETVVRPLGLCQGK